jgi:hypothetical protein
LHLQAVLRIIDKFGDLQIAIEVGCQFFEVH